MGIKMSFNEINIRDLKTNTVKMIAEDWALVSAGNEEKWNTMTVSWGGIGELWGRDVAFIFIRPQRYTLQFIEREEFFTLSFFNGGFKKELSLCGSRSGRDIDKAAACDFLPVFEQGTVWPNNAETVLICKKIAVQQMNPAGFLDEKIEENYPAKDYHKIFVGEIVKTYERAY